MPHWYRGCAAASKTVIDGFESCMGHWVNGPPWLKYPRRMGLLRKIESHPIY